MLELRYNLNKTDNKDSMVTRSHLMQAARELKKRLGNSAFVTVRRSEVTQLLRDISGEDATRLKSAMSGELERALLDQGVRCFPGFAETTAEDTVRLFHAGTVMGRLVDMLRYPAEDTDRELAAAISKMKGRWIWGIATEEPSESGANSEQAPATIRPSARKSADRVP